MEIKDLVIGVHGESGQKYGQYDALSSFSEGLLKAFQKIGAQAYWTSDCFAKGLRPHFTIGFNLLAINGLEVLLKNNIVNVLWSVDSLFTPNYEKYSQFFKYPNFVQFSVTNSDKIPISTFYPKLAYEYMPHATDPEFWQVKDKKNKKENDIVLFSSVKDYKKDLDGIRKTVSKSLFDKVMELHDILMKNPNLLFWDVYKQFEKNGELICNNDKEYVSLFYNIAYLVMYEKKINIVKELSKNNYNLKIYGNGPWEKYVSGKTQIMGPCDFDESKEIMENSKIILHPHSLTLEQGLHERVLNASAAGAFTLSSSSDYLCKAFGDSVAFYDNGDFSDVSEKVDYYLKNDEERNFMAQKARNIVLENHTWDVRANQILQMVGVKS